MDWLLLSLMAFILSSLGVSPILRYLSQSFLDLPNERSSHSRPTPRGGGLAFVPAFLITASVAAALGARARLHPAHPPTLEVLLLLPLFVVGAVDDRRGLSAGTRYLVQLVVASAAVYLFGPLSAWDQWEIRRYTWFLSPWMESVLTVLFMTALINFYNFMDGLDGLVAGTAFLQLALFGSLLKQPLWWLFAGALLGFLLWNWAPAKIFMGDAGSTVVGGAVALALVEYPYSSGGSLTGATAVPMLCGLAVTSPILVDATYTIFRRLLRRENVLKAHKSHLYQRLNQAGWSHGCVATAYVLLTLTIALFIVAFGADGAIAGALLTIALVPVVELYIHAASPGRLRA